MFKKHAWKIIAVVAAVLLAASVIYSNYVSQQANEGIELAANIKGNPDAQVKLTEYSDFQCPACGQFYPVVKEIVEQYSDQIAFEYKHFPLVTIHPYAVPAAKAAEAAAQQGKFFEMHDKLFENQTIWSRTANPTVYFDQYAEEIGLDVELYKQHYRASLIANHIDDQYKEARDKGFTGTPTFELNGQRMNFETFEDFVGQIEAALGVTTEAPQNTEAESSEPSVQFGI